MRTARTANSELLNLSAAALINAWKAIGAGDDCIDSIISALERLAPLVPKRPGPAVCEDWVDARDYYFVEDRSLRLTQRLVNILDPEEGRSAASFWQRQRAARDLFLRMREETKLDPELDPGYKFWANFEIEAAKLP